jgi:hypothetical protein
MRKPDESMRVSHETIYPNQISGIDYFGVAATFPSTRFA